MSRTLLRFFWATYVETALYKSHKHVKYKNVEAENADTIIPGTIHINTNSNDRCLGHVRIDPEGGGTPRNSPVGVFRPVRQIMTLQTASSPFLDSREGSRAENAQRGETGARRNKREETGWKRERKGLRS